VVGRWVVGLGARRRLPRCAFVAVAVERLMMSSNLVCDLASAEGDDASDGVVGRHAHGDPIARDHLNAEAAHTAAQLGQHFVAGIHLHSIQTAAMHGDHGALDINQIVLAQIRSPFKLTSIAQDYLMEIPAEKMTIRAGPRAAVASVAGAALVR
jgi:hypothetical protein